MASDLEIAWLAGLFEGEGTLSRCNETERRADRTPTVRARWVLAIQMTDADVVHRARNVAGVGRLYGPLRPPSSRGNKPIHRWAVKRAVDIAPLARAMRPHLGERRLARVDQFLAELAVKAGA